MAEATDDRLRLLIERVERLEEEKKGIADDNKKMKAWLNDRDNVLFRTRPGRV